MRRTPPWIAQNRFECLTVEQYDDAPFSETISAVPPEPPPVPIPPSEPPPIPTPLVEIPQGRRPPKSEKRIPTKLWLAADNLRHLAISVELESPHTMAKIATTAMIDSGATNIGFIDRDFVAQSGFPTRKLFQSRPVFNVDGTPNSAGSITHVVDIVLKYQDHSERLQIAVTTLGPL